MRKILCTLAASALLLITIGTTSVTAAPAKKCTPPKRHHHQVHCPAPCPEPCAEIVSCEPICNPCPPPPCYAFDTGPYAGVLIGYNHMWTRTKGVLFNFFRQNSSKSSDSFIGELSLGWRYVFPLGLTAGFEVAGDFSNDHVNATLPLARNTIVATTVRQKIKRNFSLVPSFIVGTIICNDWHAFVKFGLGVSWFKNHTTMADGRITKWTKTPPGFVPALGLEYGYNKNLSIIGTVGYEMYENMQAKFLRPIANFPGAVETKVTPKFFNLKFGILYRM